MKKIIRWVVGCLMLLMSIMIIFVKPVALLSLLGFLLLTLFIIPNSHDFIFLKLGIELSRMSRYIISFILVIISIALLPETEEGKIRKRKEAETKRLENIRDQAEKDSIAHAEAKESTLLKEATLEKTSLSIGDIGIINQDCLAGNTEDNLDELIKISISKDDYGLNEKMLEGTVFPLDIGTKVKLLDRGFTWNKLRVLSGKYTGSIAFVPQEFVSNE